MGEAVEANSITAAEINEGKNGQRKQVCIFSADLDKEGEVIVDQDGNPTTSYKENTVEFSDCEPSYSPAAGCCKFSPVFEYYIIQNSQSCLSLHYEKLKNK